MKKQIFKLAFLLFAMVTLNACSSDGSGSDDNTDPDPDPTAEKFITFKYNNTVYTLDNPSTFIDTKREVRGNQGINAQYKKLSLWMPTNVTLGAHPVTYDPTNDNSYEIHFVSQAEGLYFDANSGTINITVITDTTIEGTFQGTETDEEGNTITISEGSFRAYRND